MERYGAAAPRFMRIVGNIKNMEIENIAGSFFLILPILFCFLLILPALFWVIGLVKGKKSYLTAGIILLILVLISSFIFGGTPVGFPALFLIFSVTTLIAGCFAKENCPIKRNTRIWLGDPLPCSRSCRFDVMPMIYRMKRGEIVEHELFQQAGGGLRR